MNYPPKTPSSNDVLKITNSTFLPVINE
jgi:hypothetical protein